MRRVTDHGQTINTKMHDQAKRWTEFVRSVCPNRFASNSIRVLDVGGGDINGSNRYLFSPSCEYHCNDVGNAPNATIVCATKDLKFEDAYFDVIISTECFEHDPTWNASLKKIVALLKPNGLLVFTCGSTGRAEHGTRRTNSNASWATIDELEAFRDYYANLTINDIKRAIDLDVFDDWVSYYGQASCDLYFAGFKRPTEARIPQRVSAFPDYVADSTMITGGSHVLALQGQQLTIEHDTTVSYRAGGHRRVKRLIAGSYTCNDQLFGDPLYGIVKHVRQLL